MTTMADLDELALAMPETTKEVSEDGRPSYLVHGKMFCFHRSRRPDAIDPETGERIRPEGIPESWREYPEESKHFADLKEFHDLLEGRTLLRRLPTLAEVANMAAFMASDQAGAMTGTVVNLTCGSIPSSRASPAQRTWGRAVEPSPWRLIGLVSCGRNARSSGRRTRPRGRRMTDRGRGRGCR